MIQPYIKPISDYEILTDSGFQSFYGVRKTFSTQVFKVEFDDGSIVECTGDHKFYTSDTEYTILTNLQVNSIVRGKTITNIEQAESTFVYTPIHVENGFKYLTDNGILHRNCAFIENSIMEDLWSSVYPVISADPNSKVLIVSTPNGIDNMYYRIYSKAEAQVDDDGDKWTAFKFLWSDIPDRDSKWRDKQIAGLGGDIVRWNQEFGCVDPETTKIELMDSETGIITIMTIAEAKRMMSVIDDNIQEEIT